MSLFLRYQTLPKVFEISSISALSAGYRLTLSMIVSVGILVIVLSGLIALSSLESSPLQRFSTPLESKKCPLTEINQIFQVAWCYLLQLFICDTTFPRTAFLLHMLDFFRDLCQSSSSQPFCGFSAVRVTLRRRWRYCHLCIHHTILHWMGDAATFPPASQCFYFQTASSLARLLQCPPRGRCHRPFLYSAKSLLTWFVNIDVLQIFPGQQFFL